MRPKFVFTLLLLALLVLGAALYLKQYSGKVAPATPEIASAPATVSNVVTSLPPPPEPVPVTAAPVVTNILTDEQREAAIDAETDRLQQWSMNDDPASLSNILADLTNPEKEVREAAIEAAEQFGSTNAIPTLKAVAANTSDTEEQIALLEAANFLSLPSFTIGGSGPATPRTPEQIQADAQQKAEHDALMRAQQQKRDGNQNSPTGPNNN